MKNKKQITKKKVDAFTKAALPLIKYLNKNHHPHCTIIVTQTNAELLEGVRTTGEILKYVRD